MDGNIDDSKQHFYCHSLSGLRNFGTQLIRFEKLCTQGYVRVNLISGNWMLIGKRTLI